MKQSPNESDGGEEEGTDITDSKGQFFKTTWEKKKKKAKTTKEGAL